MDDVAEQQEIANEISDAISNPVGFGQDMDEVCRTRRTDLSPRHVKTGFLHMRKQRRRSASR